MSNEVAYSGYHYATNGAVENGQLTEFQGRILSQLGRVIQAVQEVHAPNLSHAEIMALLTLAQKFGLTLVGAIASEKGEEKFGLEYRQAVAPIMLEMLAQGVVEQSDFPQEVQKIRAERLAREAAANDDDIVASGTVQ